MTHKEVVTVRRILVVLMLLIPSIGMTQGPPIKNTILLFNGTDTDSLEQVSKWFEVEGVHRIVLKTFSTHLAFGGNADSAKVDSITTMTVLMSDSVLFIARDSAGVIVTARSTIPTVIGTHGPEYPMCADSVQYTIAAAQDTITTNTLIDNAPVNTPLRAPANGSGKVSWIWNIPPASVNACGDCTFPKRYMRIKVTPLRRNTANGTTSTQGLRTNGLRGFKMIAQLYYNPGR